MKVLEIKIATYLYAAINFKWLSIHFLLIYFAYFIDCAHRDFSIFGQFMYLHLFFTNFYDVRNGISLFIFP